MPWFDRLSSERFRLHDLHLCMSPRGIVSFTSSHAASSPEYIAPVLPDVLALPVYRCFLFELDHCSAPLLSMLALHEPDDDDNDEDGDEDAIEGS